MELSIAIVSYNVKNDLEKCLASIREHLQDISHEVIVVDNASQDGTKDMVLEKFREVKFIENRENLGFAAANNIAYRYSKGRILLFLNPDTVVDGRGYKETLSRFEGDDRSGAMGPKLLNDDRTPQRGAIRKFPGAFNTIVRMTFLRKLPFFKSFSQDYRMHDFNFNASSHVDQISGAAFFIKRDVFEKAGLFDERFFIFYEEVDLCRRLKDIGFNVVYDPGITIVHTGGQSRKQEDGRIRAINIRSLLLYFRKHLRGAKKFVFLFSFKTLFLLDVMLEFLCDVFFVALPFIPYEKKKKRNQKSAFRIYFVKNCLRSFLFRW